jgi:HlyD family secretion protein
VENAEAAMEQARLAYEAAKQQEESGLRTARSQVSTAQANLEKLTAGPVSTDVAAAQASVEQSRASLAIAQAQLDKATLRAPFAGVVGKVLADVDTQVSSATAIVVLFDPSGYEVNVEVDEVDVSRVQIGQRVHIRLDALPEVTLTARVEEIALTPTPGQAVVTYQVRVRLEPVVEATVRAGMTANVGIVTREAQGVLIVPRRAVRLVEGKTYVERVVSGAQGAQLESVEVQLGLAEPQYVEITAGLQEGNQVFVRGVVENVLQQFFGGSSSGGGMRFGGGASP